MLERWQWRLKGTLEKSHQPTSFSCLYRWCIYKKVKQLSSYVKCHVYLSTSLPSTLWKCKAFVWWSSNTCFNQPNEKWAIFKASNSSWEASMSTASYSASKAPPSSLDIHAWWFIGLPWISKSRRHDTSSNVMVISPTDKWNGVSRSGRRPKASTTFQNHAIWCEGFCMSTIFFPLIMHLSGLLCPCKT